MTFSGVLMQIQTGYSLNNYYNSGINHKTNDNKRVSDTVCFTGHAQTEQIFQKGFKRLIHQTAFDREPQTKEFVCNYIREHFGGKDKIKIVSGGCSTGEEPLSYSMRLYNMRNKVDILGIDLGKDAIKKAQSGKYIFEVPTKKTKILDFFESINASPFTDVYLVEKESKGLTPSQKYFKRLFNEFFEPTGEKIKAPFLERFYDQTLRRSGIEPLELDRIVYKLKEGKGENCSFIRDDITNIDKIVNGEKVDVISFCNSLYHLTTKDVTSGVRVPKKDSESIIESLMTKFKNCLNDGGIVVFGEDEGMQMMDFDTVPKVMKKLGFTPLNKTKEHSANVWRLDK